MEGWIAFIPAEWATDQVAAWSVWLIWMTDLLIAVNRWNLKWSFCHKMILKKKCSAPSFQPDFQAQWPFCYNSIIQCRKFLWGKELIDLRIRLPWHFSVIVHRATQNEQTAKLLFMASAQLQCSSAHLQNLTPVTAYWVSCFIFKTHVLMAFFIICDVKITNFHTVTELKTVRS